MTNTSLRRLASGLSLAMVIALGAVWSSVDAQACDGQRFGKRKAANHHAKDAKEVKAEKAETKKE